MGGFTNGTPDAYLLACVSSIIRDNEIRRKTLGGYVLIFHNNTDVADKYLERVKTHYNAREIVKGLDWEHGKGGAVGCTVHSDNYAAYETELGLPEFVAKLQDAIFEGLPEGKAQDFTLRFLEACYHQIGKNAANICWHFLHTWLVEKLTPLYERQGAEYQSVVQSCGELLVSYMLGFFNDEKAYEICGRAYDIAKHTTDESASDAAKALAYAFGCEPDRAVHFAARALASHEVIGSDEVYESMADHLIELIGNLANQIGKG